MTHSKAASGYLDCGIPYNRFGAGNKPLVVVQGLLYENKPQPRMTFQVYEFLKHAYTVYVVLRKPNLPVGYTLRDMGDDYAQMIRDEFGEPVDVIGISSGGSLVQHLAADHPESVRRLVIHSSAYTLSAEAKRLQLRVGELAGQGDWVNASALLVGSVMPRRGALAYVARPLTWLAARVLAWDAPKNPSDLIVLIQAEDKHDFKNRLAEITAPTLVIAGDHDPFYTPTLFRETAKGIPNARLVLYPGMGHPASGKNFEREVLAFLRDAA